MTNKKDSIFYREILRDESIKLIESGEVEKAIELVKNSNNNDKWKDYYINYIIPDFIRYKHAKEEKIAEKIKVDKENEKNKTLNAFLKKIKEKYLIDEDKPNFFEADQLILKENSDELLTKYEQIKFNFFRKDLNELGLSLEDIEDENFFPDEKVKALSTTNKNILVQARAGSGKTETIALKVRQLIKFYGIKSDEVLVLAFNSKAADEFRKRINEYCDDGVATKANTLTFHALAYRIANINRSFSFLQEKRNSLQHGKDDQLQSEFIQGCFNDIEKKDRNNISKLFYLFLKSFSEKFAGIFRDDNEYFSYLRNLELITIAGEKVKSKGEKYIADFLFEHKILKQEKEIRYVYEWNIKKQLNTKRPYCPDFSLFYVDDKKKENLQTVIEYFGFTRNHSGYPGFFETKIKSDEYIEESEDKKKLFNNNHNVDFIYLSVDDFNIIQSSKSEEDKRRDFEIFFKNKLEGHGFMVKNLKTEEILSKIQRVEARKKKLVGQITGFINKAQQLSYDPERIQKMAKEKVKNGRLSQRNQYFVKIARRVYCEYKNKLKKENRIDFNSLFIEAIKKIEIKKGECEIISKGKKQKIKKIKYILIDEYQDFSELFYKLIDKIREVNPSVSFFCVGDDWQAINGFAGSDLRFFKYFNSKYIKEDGSEGGNYFPNGKQVSLLTNYRSCKSIVRCSNALMSGLGIGGKSEKNKSEGGSYIFKLEHVEIRNDIKHRAEYNKDQKYRDLARELKGLEKEDKKIFLELSQYLKTIETVVKKTGKSKEICLLFRGNKILSVKIKDFTKTIKNMYPENKIISSTVHSFKGKQSRIVIVVGVNQRNFPKFHPDNELMEIFGVTIQNVLDEEKRLFYVALTRAEECSWLIYKNEKERSYFIDIIKSNLNNEF